MIKKRYELLLIITLLVFLTGCWDYLDVDHKTLVTVSGIDFENSKYTIYGEVARLRKPKNSEDEKKEPEETAKFTGSGATFDEARADVDSVSPFPNFLGITRTIILGMGIAEKGIIPFMNRVRTLAEYRKTAVAVVSRDPIDEILSIKPENDMSIGFMISDMIEQLDNSGSIVKLSLGEIFSHISMKHNDYVIPYIGKVDNSLQYLGLAVMKNSKFKGFYNIEESLGVVYIVADKPKVIQVIPYPDNIENLLSFQTNMKKRKIWTDYVDNKVVINIDMELDASLLYEYYTSPINHEMKIMMENTISNKVKNTVLSAIKKSQKEFECDVYDFIKYFRADNPKVFKSIDWENKYKEADVNVNIKTNIIRLGLVDVNAKKKRGYNIFD